MVRLLVDTSYLLDLAIRGRPGEGEALRLYELMTSGTVMAHAPSSALKDFYYIARGTLSDVLRRRWIEVFLDSFDIQGFGFDDCRKALLSDEPDFEDGLVRAMAERLGVDAIVSRDSSAFAGSRVRRVTPGEAIEMTGGTTPNGTHMDGS